MRRRDFASAMQPPRGEGFQQVVRDGGAFAGCPGEKGPQIALGADAVRNAAGASAVSVRQQPVQALPLGHPRTVGLDEPRRRKAVFGQQLDAGKSLHGVHQPTAVIAAQLRRNFHQAGDAMRIVRHVVAGLEPNLQALAQLFQEIAFFVLAARECGEVLDVVQVLRVDEQLALRAEYRHCPALQWRGEQRELDNRHVRLEAERAFCRRFQSASGAGRMPSHR